MPDSEEKFNLIKFISGPLYWRNYIKLLVYGICVLIIFSIFTTISKYLFPKEDSGNRTITKVESGGTSNITNFINQNPDLKHGIYIRGASDRVSIGVFKEVLNNIDISIGGGKDYDDDAFIEIEARLKL